MAVSANVPQCQFLSMPNKFRAFVAGFRSGKTFVGCMAQCNHFIQFPRVTQGYFAPTYPQIRDIYFPTIEEVAYNYGFRVDIKESNKEVHFYHGRKYYGLVKCRSMSKPETIIGFSLGRALVDEIDVLTMIKATDSFRRILSRLSWKADGVTNGADITTTPEGFNFVHKHFVENLEKNPNLKINYGLIQASTYDNELNLPDDYISSLLETYPKELIQAYIMGQFVNLTTGTVYYAFNRKMHNSLEFVREKEPLIIGMDFNVGKMAARVFVERGKSLHCVHEFDKIFDTPAMIIEIQSEFPEHHITIYPDASGKARKTVNASESDLSLLEDAGFSVEVNSTNPLVRDRVMSTNKQFQNMNLFVNVEKCPQTTKDLEQQAYNLNGEPDKKTGHDHGNDAFTYPVVNLHPIVKPAFNVPVTFSY